MKTKLACALVIASAVVGCAQQPKMVWLRSDGQGIRDPVLARQFELDRTVCDGDTGKAGLVALNPVTPDGGYYNGSVAAQRGALSGNVMRGCMAQKGYVLVREDEASSKAAEFAAASAEQARREASVKEPTSSARRVASAR